MGIAYFRFIIGVQGTSLQSSFEEEDDARVALVGLY